MPFRLAHRINIELNGLMEESQSKGSNSCDLFGAWFWFKQKKAAFRNICLLLLCMPSSSRMGQRAGHTTSPLYGTNFLILLFIMVPRLQHQQSYALMLVYQPQVAVTFGLGVVQVVAMQQRCVKFSWQNARDVPGFPGIGIPCPVS